VNTGAGAGAGAANGAGAGDGTMKTGCAIARWAVAIATNVKASVLVMMVS
jgi:hypothetical protein